MSDHPSELAPFVPRARRLFDLDADPGAVEGHLRTDPILLPLVEARPGLRIPGAWDGFETTVRAVLGQQVSVGAATTLASRLVRLAGEPVAASGAGTHLFPTPEALVDTDLAGIGMPGARIRTIRELAAQVRDGDVVLDGSAGHEETAAALARIPGIGPWTVAYVGMRVLRDHDAFPSTDLGVRRALERLGIGRAEIPARAEAWRPWRGYAAMHLWASLG